MIDPLEKPSVSLSSSSALSRPNGRGMRYGYDNRRRAYNVSHQPAHVYLVHRSTFVQKPVNGERRFNQVEKDANSERHNGPVATSRVLSPLPPEPTPSVVKLPASKDTQPIPRSPATTVSSLSEDHSGGSSVRFSSDTTFTVSS